MPWEGQDKYSHTFMVNGRKYWVFKITGTDIDTEDYVDILTSKNDIPIACAISALYVRATPVEATLAPELYAAPEELESNTLVAANPIINKTCSVLTLTDGILRIVPKGNTDGLTVKIKLVLVDGHNLRGF